MDETSETEQLQYILDEMKTMKQEINELNIFKDEYISKSTVLENKNIAQDLVTSLIDGRVKSLEAQFNRIETLIFGNTTLLNKLIDHSMQESERNSDYIRNEALADGHHIRKINWKIIGYICGGGGFIAIVELLIKTFGG